MTESDLKQLFTNQTGGGSGSNPFSQALEPLMPMLTLLFIVSVILSIVFVIYFIVSIVQKQRQHRAIIRIDKNLQKLVDSQVDSPKPISDEE